MNIKGQMSERFYRREFAIAGIFVILLIFVSGCSKSVPKCDDGKTVKAVINTVSEDFKKDLAAVAGMGAPGMELTDDEWRTIRAGMVIDLEEIREQSFDEAADKRICAANLMVVSGGAKELIPVTFVTERNRDSGEVKITLSGLDEFRESAYEEMPLPE